ncbi:WSC domain-containing protein [Gloeopeniophorella convolvens]|nr:WSC domain-containing protein [Gloeopeniophorella convolvens]
MTVEACIDFCTPSGFVFAGVEFAAQFCDYALQPPGTQVDPSQCNIPCTGNSTEICGGPLRMSLYTNGHPQPSVQQEVLVGSDKWVYAGCLTDSAGSRTLLNRAPATFDGFSTAEEAACVIYCDAMGFFYAGLELGSQCWCGDELGTSATRVNDTNCHIACSGDPTHSEFCGGLSSLTVYHKDICAGSDQTIFWVIAILQNAPSTGPTEYYVVTDEAGPGTFLLTVSPRAHCMRRSPPR